MEKLKEKNVKDKRKNSYNCEKELFLDKKLEDFFHKMVAGLIIVFINQN